MQQAEPQAEPQADLSVFLVSSVHDMKNSLGLLSAMLEKMLSDLSPETYADYAQLAHMFYEVKRVNSNLIHLLAVYKLGNQLYPFDPQYHVVADFLREVASQAQPLIASSKVQFEVECDEAMVWHFDDDLVSGMINHALNNAVHYTRERVKLIARVIGSYLEIRIEDDGRGYPPAMLLDGSELGRKAIDFAGGSTGLGLFFASKVAQLHRNRGRSGGIRLENGGEYGGGCFVLQLP